MFRITDIKAKINVLEGGAFQELCDALLARKGYEEIHAYGMQAGTMKTTKGNPRIAYMDGRLAKADGDKEIKLSPYRDLRFWDNFVLFELEIYCIATKIIL